MNVSGFLKKKKKPPEKNVFLKTKSAKKNQCIKISRECMCTNEREGEKASEHD